MGVMKSLHQEQVESEEMPPEPIAAKARRMRREHYINLSSGRTRSEAVKAFLGPSLEDVLDSTVGDKWGLNEEEDRYENWEFENDN